MGKALSSSTSLWSFVFNLSLMLVVCETSSSIHVQCSVYVATEGDETFWSAWNKAAISTFKESICSRKRASSFSFWIVARARSVLFDELRAFTFANCLLVSRSRLSRELMEAALLRNSSCRAFKRHGTTMGTKLCTSFVSGNEASFVGTS